jgi:hypothetical protein
MPKLKISQPMTFRLFITDSLLSSPVYVYIFNDSQRFKPGVARRLTKGYAPNQRVLETRWSIEK